MTAFDKYKDVQLLDATSTLEAKEAHLKANEKDVKAIVKEIKEFKRRNYYFIEPWENENLGQNKMYVILLREVRILSRKLCDEIAIGVDLKYKALSVFDELLIQSGGDSFAYIQATLRSPYMEHLTQTFFHNFGRIGINDYDDDLETHLTTGVL